MARTLFPYIFDAAVIEVKRRNPCHRYVGGWRNVEIEEVSGLDAPVSMTWTKAGDHNHVRWHRDHHYVPFLGRVEPSAKTARSDYVEGRVPYDVALACLDLSRHGQLALQDHYEGKLAPIHDRQVKEVYWTNEDIVMMEAEAGAGALLLVDGELYIRSREPRYRIGFWQGHATVSVSAHFRNSYERTTERNPRACAVFSAARLDDAMVHAATRAEEVRVYSGIEVHMPDTLTFDDETFSLEMTARRLVYGDATRYGLRCELSESALTQLHAVDAAEAMSWFRLRDHLTAAHARGRLDVDGIASEMRVLAEALPDGPFKEEASAALQRWDLRPLNLSLPGFRM